MGTGREGPLKFPGTFAAAEKNNGGDIWLLSRAVPAKKQRFMAGAWEKNIQGHLLDHFLFFELQTLHWSEFQPVSDQLPNKAKNADLCLIWYFPITKVLAHDSCDWLFTRPRNIWRRGKWKMRKIFGEGMYLVCQTPSKAQLSLVQLSTAVYSCWISLIIFSTSSIHVEQRRQNITKKTGIGQCLHELQL